MKDKIKYSLYICNVLLIGLIAYNLFSYDTKTQELNTYSLETQNRKYISYLKVNNLKTDNLLEETIEKESKEEEIEEVKIDEVKEEIIVEKNEYQVEKVEENVPVKEEVKEEPVEIVTEDNAVSSPVIETLVGSLAGYGPDCVGCTSMMTASGRYIGEGNIYFDDPTYGKIRILAGDYSYPFGTIVKISNVDFYNDEPFYGIVLDRGGNIGKGKTFLFDLLFASESEASKMGKEVNIKYEIIRLGY